MTRHLLLAAASLATLSFSAAASARPMTATDMHMMRRVGTPEVSPDGRWAVFTLSSTDLKANKRNNVLHLLDLTKPSAAPQPIAGAEQGHDAMFTRDGSLWFLMPAGQHEQIFRMKIGGAPEQVSSFKSDVSGFKVAPRGNAVVVWADRHSRCDLLDCVMAVPDDKGSATAYDQLFVRHWDAWAEPGVRSRLYAFPVVGGRIEGPGRRVTGQLEGDTPSKPFGGGEEIAFSPDGQTVFFALREAGRIEATSTNLDIFAVPTNLASAPVNLTDANDATDTLPTVSPDGRTLAYVAMARPGYEADRQVIHLRDLASGQVRPLTQNWDRSVGSLAWSNDGKSLLVTAGDTLEEPVFRVDVATGRVTRLTPEGHAANVRPLPDGGALLTINSVHAPDDIYRLDRRGRLRQLTNVNRDLLAELDPVSLEKFSFAGANGDRVWGIKVKPKAAEGKLPVAYIVHGGPQGSLGNAWSYRWNPRVFASPGYGVVSVDFHGSTGYGQAFTDSINRDWGGKPLEDLKLGLAHALAADPQLDGDRACALGASYGGYMLYWMLGNWADRFDCIVSHNGVFDTRSMGFMTEELWFSEWEFGGPPWQTPEVHERWNPLNHVTRWKTPTLVVISDKDFRVPYTQGLGAFTALQRQDIPSRLLRFPDENHWVLKPRNSIRWYDEVLGWMGKWTAGGAERR